MNTPEGLGLSRARWYDFERSLPDDVREAAFGGGVPISSLPEALREHYVTEVPKAMKERSELIGFWVTWHLAGGFENLERSGWHRSTIFRKVRRFRAEFGAHPDVHEFPWLTLDHHRYWMAELDQALGIGE